MAQPPAAPIGDHILHVERLARCLMQQQEDAAATEQHHTTGYYHRIVRVPNHTRGAQRDAYQPGLVTIGPLHAADSRGRLRPGQRLKMAYLNSLISRGHPDPARHLAVIQGYIRLVAAREQEARAMYAAEDVDGVSPEDFVQMMVLDGCFIIEHLVNVAARHEEQSLYTMPFGPTQLSVDLILAENQMPFFVLVDLMRGTRLPEFDTSGWLRDIWLPQFDTTGYDPLGLLKKLVLFYLAGDMGIHITHTLPSVDGFSHILHLLHETVTKAHTAWQPHPPRYRNRKAVLDVLDGAVTRTVHAAREAARLLKLLPLMVVVMFLYPTVPEERRWSSRYGPVDVPTATDMRWLWVRLKKTRSYGPRTAAVCIASVLGPVALVVRLDSDGALQLPQLQIEFRTAPLLLNLIAFEQAAEQKAGAVSAYVWFMAKLVEAPEDAAALAAAEVVQKSSGSNEDVVRFFRLVGSASEATSKLDPGLFSLRETLGPLRERTLLFWLLTKRADVQRYIIDVPWRLVAALVTVVTTITAILQTLAALKQRS